MGEWDNKKNHGYIDHGNHGIMDHEINIDQYRSIIQWGKQHLSWENHGFLSWDLIDDIDVYIYIYIMDIYIYI